jgi:hypothetical protein
MRAYLQHGALGGPYLTESVEVKESLLDWQRRGLSYTASGYGARIATGYMVRYEGRWRRVYSYCYSNVGTTFIGRKLGDPSTIVVDIWRD